jgi:hypothetical protein
MISQQDLNASELNLTTRSSPAHSPAPEESDIEARGRELATRCWVEDEEFLAKEKIAEWLGGQ